MFVIVFRTKKNIGLHPLLHPGAADVDSAAGNRNKTYVFKEIRTKWLLHILPRGTGLNEQHLILHSLSNEQGNNGCQATP